MPNLDDAEYRWIKLHHGAACRVVWEG